MTKNVVVDIHGVQYQGILDEEEKLVSIFNVVEIDDVDFLGRFWVDGNNLVEFFPMSQRKVIIGEIVSYS